MKCAACGQETPEGSAFCSGCGAPLTGAAPNPAQPAAAAILQPRARGPATPTNEETLWSGSYSIKAMIGWIIGAALLSIAGVVVAIIMARPLVSAGIGIAVLVLWVIIGLNALYRRMSISYQLTSFRLFHEAGILRRTRDRIEVIDIDDVTLQQGFVERMLNVGSIYIRSSDTTNPNLSMIGIDNARQVTDLIDNTRRAERQRRGIFMENV
jgi:membrane protein YdbS with pleckstrin-like domain